MKPATTTNNSKGTICGYLVFSAPRRQRMAYVAVMPDGTKQTLHRTKNGYRTPTGSYASPLSYALEKWRMEGAVIRKQPIPTYGSNEGSVYFRSV
jgi:hypothetical protein